MCAKPRNLVASMSTRKRNQSLGRQTRHPDRCINLSVMTTLATFVAVGVQTRAALGLTSIACMCWKAGEGDRTAWIGSFSSSWQRTTRAAVPNGVERTTCVAGFSGDQMVSLLAGLFGRRSSPSKFNAKARAPRPRPRWFFLSLAGVEKETQCFIHDNIHAATVGGPGAIFIAESRFARP